MPAGGYIEVGHNEKGEVVVNLDRDRTGHLIFSPQQARDLAVLMFKKAKVAADEQSGLAEPWEAHSIDDAWGVFAAESSDGPVAIFTSEEAATRWRDWNESDDEHGIGCDLVVCEMRDVSGMCWNSIDPIPAR